MKTSPHSSRIAACALALVALPVAFAGHGSDKFQKMDANGDGKVSRSEHSAAAHQMFIQADSNGDGVLTAAELAVKHDSKADSTARGTSSTRGNPNEDGQHAADKIKVIDRDGDGRITSAEHEAGTASMFAKMDTDGDGFLSEAECDAGHKKMK